MLLDAGIAPTPRKYGPGDSVYRQGFPAEGMVFIRTGLAKTQLLAANGQEVLVCLVGPGHILGDVEYFNGGAAVCSVLAVEPVSADFVPFERMAALRRLHPEVDGLMGRSLAARLTENARRLERSYCYPLEYNVLVAALSRLGMESRALRKADLQEYLGVSSRHLNRVMAQLASVGLVAVDRGLVEVTDAAAARHALAKMEGS